MLLLLNATAFAQKAGTEGGGSRYRDELQKDDSAMVAASAEQIQSVLRSDSGLLLELKQWIASEVAKRGQVLLEEDLSDLEVLRRLTWDRDLRLAATRMLQRYGHLLPTAKPGSDAALQKEKAAAEALQPDKKDAPSASGAAAFVPQGAMVAMPRTVSNPQALPADAFTNPLELSPAAPFMAPLPQPSGKAASCFRPPLRTLRQLQCWLPVANFRPLPESVVSRCQPYRTVYLCNRRQLCRVRCRWPCATIV